MDQMNTMSACTTFHVNYITIKKKQLENQYDDSIYYVE